MIARRRSLFILGSITIAVVLISLSWFLFSGSFIKTLLNKTDSSTFPFTIQVFMWLILAVGLGDLLYRWLVARKERVALSGSLLSAEANRIFTIEDMPDIHSRAKAGDTELSELIATLALRFHSGKSVEQTQQLLNSQLELWQYRVELDYNLVRYISWLLPTIGFLGTVVGIGQALTFAGNGEIDPESAQFLPAVTSQLGLAFDTTMLALMMSVVLVFLLHLVQGQEERVIEASGRYCLNNLITRLYVASN